MKSFLRFWFDFNKFPKSLRLKSFRIFLLSVSKSSFFISSFRLLFAMVSSNFLHGKFHSPPPSASLFIIKSHLSFRLSQLTELFSTTFVLHLANKENCVTSRKVLCIVGISLLHIIAGSVDQFIQNVFLGEGKLWFMN